MRRLLLGVLWLLVFSRLASADLQAMGNDALDEVTGQQGVAISLDWRLNADKDGTVLPLCTSASTYRECRIGWAFNNRGVDDCGGNCGTNIGKKWLVLKGFSGALYIPYLTVNASSVTYTSKTSTSVTVPAVLLSLGDPNNSYSGANTKVQVKQLIIDDIAFEQDNTTRRGYFADSACEPTGTGTGVCNGLGANIPSNVNTGFLSLQINGPGNVANIQVDGTVKLYSCLSNNPAC